MLSSCKGSWQSTLSGFRLQSKKTPSVHCRAQATSAVPRQKGSSDSGASAHGGAVTPKLLFHRLGGNDRNREGTNELPIKLRAQSAPGHPPLMPSSLWLFSLHPRPLPTHHPAGARLGRGRINFSFRVYVIIVLAIVTLPPSLCGTQRDAYKTVVFICQERHTNDF